MPKPTKGPRLGGGPAHERLLLSNLANALFTHGRITTTETKAKRMQPLAERLITFGKRGDLHARRRVIAIIRDKTVVHTLFTEIAPQMAERQGGYTRITKLGFRKGDNAPMASIELVLEPVSGKPAPVTDRRQPTVAPVADTAATDETATDETATDETATDDATADDTTADVTTEAPVDETETIEASAPVESEDTTAAAAEVEADAAEKSDDAK